MQLWAKEIKEGDCLQIVKGNGGWGSGSPGWQWGKSPRSRAGQTIGRQIAFSNSRKGNEGGMGEKDIYLEGVSRVPLRLAILA